jgi:putative FmdB family regulatory protein
MPVYTYRREDGTTFDIRQKFSDDPLTVDPGTGQKLVRVVHAAGVIFKGSGFYVNDSKSGSNGTSIRAKNENGDKSSENGDKTADKAADKKAEKSTDKKAETTAKAETATSKKDSNAAAD